VILVRHEVDSQLSYELACGIDALLYFVSNTTKQIYLLFNCIPFLHHVGVVLFLHMREGSRAMPILDKTQGAGMVGALENR
jgi:hypothetical protein